MQFGTTVPLTTRDGLKLLVRRLSSSDAGALQQFGAALSVASRSRFLPHTYDDETVAKALHRSENGEDLLLGLFDGDRMVGYFFLWYYTRRVPLLGIGILDAYQDCGLGQQMMHLLIDQAKGTGKEGIELTTLRDNLRAFALYEKVGFKHHGDVENLDGTGRVAVERGMFYEIIPGAAPYEGPHAPPI